MGYRKKGEETRRVIEPERWAAARELSEGLPPTRERVAAVLGCNQHAVYARAYAETWRTANFARRETRRAWNLFMAEALAGAVSRGRVSQAELERMAGVADAAGLDAAAGAAGPEGGEAAAAGDPGAVSTPAVAAADARGRADADDVDPDWAGRGDLAQAGFARAARAVLADAALSDAALAEAAGEQRRDAGRDLGEAGGAGAEADDRVPDGGSADDPGAMLARGARFLSLRLSRLMRQAERGAAISKNDIDSLTAMTRMMDRWETLEKERARTMETDRDAGIAEALRKIDRRILALARAEAERLVAAGGAG